MGERNHSACSAGSLAKHPGPSARLDMYQGMGAVTFCCQDSSRAQNILGWGVIY